MAMAAKILDPENMASGSPLACVIGRFASAGAGSKSVESNCEPGAMSKIAREINETVLPRKILIIQDGQEAAQLLVSNRRLYGIEIDGKGGQTVPEDGRDAAEFFAGCLKSALDLSNGVQLRAEACSFDKAEHPASCTARSLALAAGVPLGDRTILPGLEPFRDAVATLTDAWLMVNTTSEAEEKCGPDDDVDGLRAVHKEAQAKIQSRFSQRSAMCTILPVAKGRNIVRAVNADCHFLAVIDGENVETVVAEWQRQF